MARLARLARWLDRLACLLGCHRWSMPGGWCEDCGACDRFFGGHADCGKTCRYFILFPKDRRP